LPDFALEVLIIQVWRNARNDLQSLRGFADLFLVDWSPLLTASLKKEARFLRAGWARRWPAGTMMVACMITHEAHHRGQVCMLANQFGFKLPGAVTAGM
jgi:uncharacterized damage-inducible protein DinB